MKVKLRKYEQLLVASLAGMAIVHFILQRLNLAPIYLYGFRHAHFNYAEGLFLPRIGVVMLFTGVYFWFNLFTIRQFRDARRKSFFTYLAVLVQPPLLAYLLAISINIASYYAQPALNNYGEFQLFAFFGYNDHPLTDLWAGFSNGIVFMGIYGVYALIREYTIYFVESSGTKRNYRILIINQITVCFCIVFLLPVLLTALFDNISSVVYSVYFIFVPSVLFVYFSNTYWLFPRFASGRGISYPFGWRLVVSTAFYSLPFALFLNKSGLATPHIWQMNWAVQLIVITPLTWMLYLQRRDQIRELRGAEIALSKSTADLQFLRSQINPHFLFNVLNTLYGTALVDGSKRTANGIQMLGDMMRFMLDDNHLDFIPLSNEVNYLQNYIALQKLRIDDSEQIQISEVINIDTCAHQIMPMLLIPFVENAFKHGVDVNRKSWIHISLTCNDDIIRLRVTNSVHASEMNDPEQRHSGIGLQNVKDRLQLFYEGRHTLHYGPIGDEFIVDLVIDPKSYEK